MTKPLEGKPVADKIYKRISELISHNLERKGRPPHLVIFYSLENEESRIYVGKKVQACERCGIKCTAIVVEKTDTYETLRKRVMEEGRRSEVDGIIIQLPMPNVPPHLIQNLIDCIHPDKDVDGLTTASSGLLYKGKRIMWRIPATAQAVLAILQHYGISTEGKNITIIGRSELVGKPLAHILSSPGFDGTVTLCHSKTPRYVVERHIDCAEILITAVGKANFIAGYDTAVRAYVIDVGISKTPDGIKGDVLWNPWRRGQTPVPGGVGPVTVACLLENTVLRWSYTDERI